MIFFKHFILFIITISLIFSLPAGADPLDLPFSPGEELSYKIRWQKIKAGTCSIKVLPLTLVDNLPVFHFQLTVNSNKLVDRVHKFREVVESFVHKDFSASLLYKRTSKGKRKKQVIVEFSREKKEAVYSNFGQRLAPIEIFENTFDPLASFYRMRTLDFGVGNTLTFPISDGKKTFYQRGEVIQREKIPSPWGIVDTYVLTPYVTHFSGVFERSKDPRVRVWISADEKKIPIKVRVKVAVGSIILDLVSFKTP